jgi:p-aminobenzoyl-glutamate transporter AbgT
LKSNRKSKLEELKEDNKANTAAAVFAVIMLIVGFAVAGLLYTFTSVLGGQTYELVEDDIDAITNATISEAIKAGIVANFEAQQQIGEYMPIIALAIIITIVISLIITGIASRFMGPGMGGYGGYGGGYGGQVL